MKYLGSIEAKSDPRGIDFEQWVALIREHPNLMHVEPREGINPFTRKPLMFRPHSGTALVVSEGKEIGTMDWAPDGSNQIGVDGVDERVVVIARNVAERLSAVFLPEAN